MLAKSTFIDLSEKGKKRIDTKHADVSSKLRQLPQDRFERFQKLFERIDAQDMRQMCVDSLRGITMKDKAKFCLSPEWMSWLHKRRFAS